MLSRPEIRTGKAGFGSSFFLLLSFLADVVSYILASYAYGPKIWRQNVLKWPKDGTPAAGPLRNPTDPGRCFLYPNPDVKII